MKRSNTRSQFKKVLRCFVIHSVGKVAYQVYYVDCGEIEEKRCPTTITLLSMLSL